MKDWFYSGHVLPGIFEDLKICIMRKGNRVFQKNTLLEIILNV